MIEAMGLTKRYGRLTAVDDVSFEVRPGQVTGLCGPSGSGKSAVLRLMLQLDRGKGRTLFDGRRYRELRQPMRHVGAVLDPYSCHPARTARDHLRMIAAATKAPKSRIDEVLELVGLTSEAGTKPGGLTLGMAQRLAIAAAVLADPPILILDEPAVGLEAQGVAWLHSFLRAYAIPGRTVFVASADVDQLCAVAEHLVVLEWGRVLDSVPAPEYAAKRSDALAAAAAADPALAPVIVRGPDLGDFGTVLTAEGGEVSSNDDTSFLVKGLDRAAIGALAHSHGVLLHELADRVGVVPVGTSAHGSMVAPRHELRDLMSPRSPGAKAATQATQTTQTTPAAIKSAKTAKTANTAKTAVLPTGGEK